MLAGHRPDSSVIQGHDNSVLSCLPTDRTPAQFAKATISVGKITDLDQSRTREKPAYRMLLIDDSEKAFPNGESRALPLIGVETPIQAGEHKLPLHPGMVSRVPPVRKVNGFNMAQTNFYYQTGGSWLAFTERQLQFLNAYRRIFIIHARRVPSSRRSPPLWIPIPGRRRIESGR